MRGTRAGAAGAAGAAEGRGREGGAGCGYWSIVQVVIEDVQEDGSVAKSLPTRVGCQPTSSRAARQGRRVRDAEIRLMGLGSRGERHRGEGWVRGKGGEMRLGWR